MTTISIPHDGATVLVLGATGSVGSALINELLQRPLAHRQVLRAAAI